MKRICAWCKKDLGSPDTDSSPTDTPITHGICGDCARQVLLFNSQTLDNFLNRFPNPVFYLDSNTRIVASNNAGYSLLNKEPEEVNGKLGGVAFECRYADLPGGCGKTVHCKTCTIRNTVEDTLKTGKAHVKVPAYPDLHHITEEFRIRFLISTERVDNAVLLRIDEVVQEPAT